MTNPQSLANGRYLLVEPLGEGGMATVYRAYDQRLQVWRAIKILSPEYSSKPKLKARFETEAQTMALLEHTHIVRVYDVGREGDCAYIVMELVEGGSLVDWLEVHGPMPPRLAVDVTLQVCAGIAAAHAKGVIHRDIKPHNVMVTTEGICRVTDFGIARVQDHGDGMTKTGAVMGTWGYMAPEQRTDAKTVDESADVYAIAASLYSLLTNKMPMDLFAADRDASMMEGIPEVLLPVLVTATEYRREDRYNTVGEFEEALRAVREELDPIGDDTPSLVLDPGEPPPIPDPEDYVVHAAPTDPTLLGNQPAVGGTIMPADGVSPEAAPTLLPRDTPASMGDRSFPEQAEVPRQVGPVYTPAVGQLDPSSEVAPPPRRRRRRRQRAVFAWLLAFGMGAIGLVLTAIAVVLVLYGLPDGGGLEPVDDPVVDGGEGGDPVADAEDTDDDPGPDPPPIRQTGPSETRPSPTPRTTPRPSPTPTGSGTSSGRTPTPTPSPTDPGTGTNPDDPGTSTDDPQTVQVVTLPQTRQCVQVSPPLRISPSTGAKFSAKLCEEDGTEVTLWYRPSGTSEWQSRLMPVVLGSHRTTVSIDGRYTEGLEYWVEAGPVADGSASSPHHVPL